MNQYKLHWGFILSWGIAWLVLTYFVFLSLSSSNSIIERVALLLDGVGYGGVLVSLTLPFWIALRKRVVQSRNIFNVLGCVFGIYTLICFQVIYITVLDQIERKISNALGLMNLPTYVLFLLSIMLYILVIFITYQYWKTWLKGMIHVSRHDL